MKRSLKWLLRFLFFGAFLVACSPVAPAIQVDVTVSVVDDNVEKVVDTDYDVSYYRTSDDLDPNQEHIIEMWVKSTARACMIEGTELIGCSIYDTANQQMGYISHRFFGRDTITICDPNATSPGELTDQVKPPSSPSETNSLVCPVEIPDEQLQEETQQ